MSEIVDRHGVVPLKCEEAVACFYVQGWVGGKSYYVCQVQRGSSPQQEHYTGDVLDEMMNNLKAKTDTQAEIIKLWREYRREIEDNQWAKKTGKVEIVRAKKPEPGTLVH